MTYSKISNWSLVRWDYARGYHLWVQKFFKIFLGGSWGVGAWGQGGTTEAHSTILCILPAAIFLREVISLIWSSTEIPGGSPDPTWLILQNGKIWVRKVKLLTCTQNKYSISNSTLKSAWQSSREASYIPEKPATGLHWNPAALFAVNKKANNLAV